MKFFSSFFAVITKPNEFAKKALFRLAPYIKDDKLFIKLKWKLNMNYPLDLNNPTTFNEKLQWLKLHDHNSSYTKMVDKFEVKEYVAKIIGRDYIIPTLAVYDRTDDIDFDSLPSQFVLKCTHDSGGVVICKDKDLFDKDKAKKRLDMVLKRNFYNTTREWPYKDVRPRIIAEKFMTDSGRELKDYKVHVFNGEPKLILICKDRYNDNGLSEDFYTTEWKHLDVARPSHPNASKLESRPDELDEILQLSRKLSKGIPFVRIDFYIINHKVYFGEITFYPASGTVPFVPKGYDELFGSWLNIN